MSWSRAAYGVRIELSDDEPATVAAPALSEDELIERFKSTFDAQDVEPEQPEPEEDMPQPNMNKMLKQVQQMQADMAKAQEQLKHEVVEASAGGGMVTVKVTGDLEVKEITIKPGRARRGGEIALRTSRCSRTWSWRPSTRRSARHRSSRTASSAASRGGLDLGGLGLGPACSFRSLFAPPVNRLITELAKLPGIAHGAAARVPHPAGARAGRLGLSAAIKEVKERIGLCETSSTSWRPSA